MYKQDQYIVFISFIVFKLTYDYICIQFLPEANFYALNVNSTKYVITWIVSIVFSMYAGRNEHSMPFSRTVIFFLFYLYFIPMVSLYALMDLPDMFFILVILYWIFINVFLEYCPKFKLKNFREPPLTREMLYFFTVSISIVLLIFVYRYNRFTITFDLSATYDVREMAANANIPILIGVLRYFAGGFLYPILISYFLYQKKWILLTMAVGMQLCMFSIAMDKTFLFMIPVSMACAVLAKKFHFVYRTKITFSIVLTSLNIIALLEHVVFQTAFLIVLIIRRTFFDPTVMNFFYYDFMVGKEKLYLREGLLLHRFFEPVHGSPIINFIADRYIDNPFAAPNSGMFAEAYTQFGDLGVIILPLFLIIYLKIIDSVSLNVHNAIMLPVVIIISVLLQNIDIAGGTFIYSYILLLIFLLLFALSRKPRQVSWVFAGRRIL